MSEHGVVCRCCIELDRSYFRHTSTILNFVREKLGETYAQDAKWVFRQAFGYGWLSFVSLEDAEMVRNWIKSTFAKDEPIRPIEDEVGWDANGSEVTSD